MSASVQTTSMPNTAAAVALGDGVAAKGSRLPFARLAKQRLAPLFFLSVLGSFICLALALPSAIVMSGQIPLGVLLAAAMGHAVALVLVGPAKRMRMGALVAVGVFTALLAWAVAHTGGLFSPLVMLFVLAPIEALLAQRARCTTLVFAITAAGLLVAVFFAPHAAQSVVLSQSQLLLVSMVGLLYALSLAARIVRIGAMRDLRAQAARRAIDQFHAVTHDMYLTIKRDGTIERALGATDQILGCPSSALRGTGFVQRLHVSDRPSFLTTLDHVHATGKRATVDVRLRVGAENAPQHFLWAEVDFSALEGSGDGYDVYALVRDISASKQRASELVLAREKAEASDAAKGRFLATMSHELRTPLNAIIGFADILDEEVFGALANDQQREYVGLIRDSGGHLLQLVNDLLDMSKLDAGHFHIVAEPFALDTVVQRCTRLVSQQIEKAELKLVLDVPEGMPELVADQRAIRQVLINLLSNATKFTPAGGTITLRARKDGATLVLSVIDTGIGIAAQDLSKIGEPFFQANNAYDRNHQGTGLGLSVVKGLCELHAGSLGLTSVEGEGTTVTVRLPFAGPADAPEAASQAVDQHVANTVVMAKLQSASARQPTAKSSAHDSRTQHAPPQDSPPQAAAPQVAANASSQEVSPTVTDDQFEEEGRRAHG